MRSQSAAAPVEESSFTTSPIQRLKEQLAHRSQGGHEAKESPMGGSISSMFATLQEASAAKRRNAELASTKPSSPSPPPGEHLPELSPADPSPVTDPAVTDDNAACEGELSSPSPPVGVDLLAVFEATECKVVLDFSAFALGTAL